MSHIRDIRNDEQEEDTPAYDMLLSEIDPDEVEDTEILPESQEWAATEIGKATQRLVQSTSMAGDSAKMAKKMALRSGHQCGYEGCTRKDFVDEKREEEKQKTSSFYQRANERFSKAGHDFADSWKERPRKVMAETRLEAAIGVGKPCSSKVKAIAKMLGDNVDPSSLMLPRYIASMSNKALVSLIKKCREGVAQFTDMEVNPAMVRTLGLDKGSIPVDDEKKGFWFRRWTDGDISKTDLKETGDVLYVRADKVLKEVERESRKKNLDDNKRLRNLIDQYKTQQHINSMVAEHLSKKITTRWNFEVMRMKPRLYTFEPDGSRRLVGYPRIGSGLGVRLPTETTIVRRPGSENYQPSLSGIAGLQTLTNKDRRAIELSDEFMAAAEAGDPVSKVVTKCALTGESLVVRKTTGYRSWQIAPSFPINKKGDAISMRTARMVVTAAAIIAGMEKGEVENAPEIVHQIAADPDIWATMAVMTGHPKWAEQAAVMLSLRDRAYFGMANQDDVRRGVASEAMVEQNQANLKKLAKKMKSVIK